MLRLITRLAVLWSLSAVFLGVSCPSLCAQTRSTYALEIGAVRITDTYLSPLPYSGVQMALTGDWSRKLSWRQGLGMSFEGRLEASRLLNPAGNATEWQAAASFSWVVARNWNITDRLSLAAGGGTGLFAGVIYLPRNSNNPASGKAQLSGLGVLSASYRLKLGRLPVTITDRALTPVVSMLFSQDYGQPYYNIYLGNRAGLLHAGWWGNNFCIDNLLNARLHFSQGDLGVGYRLRLYSSYICRLNTRILSHVAVISWTPAHH